MKTGLAVAAIHCLLVLGIAGKYFHDRARFPVAWAIAVPVDPNAPIRGRYVSLRLEVDCPAGANTRGTLHVEDGRLVARQAAANAPGAQYLYHGRAGICLLSQPVAYFIPEHAQDPSHLEFGKNLWVQVSVPPEDMPRPLRLEVR